MVTTVTKERISVIMNILYNEKQFEVVDLIDVIEVETKFFYWQTLNLIFKDCNIANKTFTMHVSEAGNCLLKIKIR
jgi:hypothetical protein